MNKKLLKNTFFLYIFSIVRLVFPMITLPYLTRVLSTDIYGVVAYVKAYNSYVILVLEFGFLLSATKKIATANGDYKIIGLETGNVLVEKMLLAIPMAVITLIATTGNELLSANSLFVWIYFFSSFISIFTPDFLFRGIEKMEYISIPFATAKIIVTVMTFFVVKSDQDFMWIAILEVCGNFASAFIAYLIIRKLHIKIMFGNIKQWMQDIKESSTYFFSNCATTVFSLLTTLIVGTYLRPTDIAYWSLCMQFVSAAKAMYNPITNSIYPYMIINRDMKLVNKLAKLFCIPMICGCVLVLFGGEFIVTLVGGEQYKMAGRILVYLLPVFVSGFYSMLYGWPVLGAIGKIKETTMSTIISAVLQLVVMAGLIITDNLSLFSMAISCCVGEVSLLIIRIIVVIINKNEFSSK